MLARRSAKKKETEEGREEIKELREKRGVLAGAAWTPAQGKNKKPGGDLLSRATRAQYHRRWRA